MIPENKDRCTATDNSISNVFPITRCFREVHNDENHRFHMTEEEVDYFFKKIDGKV